MTLRWIEGFELFGVGSGKGDLLADKYPAGASWADATFGTTSTSRNGGAALYTAAITAYYLETAAFASQGTWITGFAFHVQSQFEQSSPTDQTILEIVDGSTVHLRIRLAASTTLTTAQFEVVRGDGTSLGTTTTVFEPDQWYFIELKVTIGDSSGVIVIIVDEQVDLNLSGVDTRNGGNASADRVRLYTGWHDTSDFVILDDW